MVKLDIISDPICPWCYIGKANLDRAIEETGLNPFDIEWRIFQLNPDMPREGADRKTYLETKFGGPERAQAIYGRIREAAAEAGLDVHFDKIQRTPNTMDAHRLIRWSQSTGNQGALVDQLFQFLAVCFERMCIATNHVASYMDNVSILQYFYKR